MRKTKPLYSLNDIIRYVEQILQLLIISRILVVVTSVVDVMHMIHII